ncbi:hypothetical protein IT568_04370, partial [bacterium]|nr:hypothetical protein [bacterium]
MKKFLYVEDELPLHKENILRLFDKFLTEEEKKALKEVGNDEFGSTNLEIKNALKNCSLVEVESSFPETLQKIKENPDGYELFVIDRNLAKDAYTFEQIRKTDSDFTEERLKKFRQREGDYFLRYFANHNRKNLEKLYFLTGNDDAFRDGDELKDLLENFDLNEFRSTHFFEKGRQEDTKTLLKLINDSETINLQRENRFYLEVLEKWLGATESSDFTKILLTKNKTDKLKSNLKDLRELQEKLLKKLASEVFPGLRNKCLGAKLNVRGALKWLNENPATL